MQFMETEAEGLEREIDKAVSSIYAGWSVIPYGHLLGRDWHQWL
jgi:hypothetical protein